MNLNRFLFFVTVSWSPLFATTFTFNSASGDWGDMTKWTPNGVPNSMTDEVVFPGSATVNMDGNFDIGTINVNAFPGVVAFNGAGILTIYQAITSDTGGVFSFNGEAAFGAQISISAEAVGGFNLASGSGGFSANGQVSFSSGTYSGPTQLVGGDADVLFVSTSPSSAISMDGQSIFTIETVCTAKSLDGSGSVYLPAGESWTVGDNTTTSFSGQLIDGGGSSLIKQGSGNFTLSGSNNYSAGTSVTAGTLTCGSNSALGTGTLTLANGTTLAISTNIALGNPISIATGATTSVQVASGLGSLTGSTANTTGVLSKTGAGILVLSGSNQHSGGTNLTAGAITLQSNSGLGTGALTMATGTTLALQGGVSASNSVAIAAGGTGTVNVDTGTATLSGAISGVGSNLTKTGSAILALTGTSGYSGATTVSAGTLAVNGNISSSSGIIVQSGAVLKGTGIASSVTVQNGATLYPGNSIGTLQVDTVTFNASSIFQVEINPSTSSLLQVTGSADLAGTVDVVQNAGSYPQSQQYLILSAGSLSGSFNPNVTGGINGHPFMLTQIGNNIYLSYTVPPIQVSDLSGNSLSGNALVIANYLNQNSDTAALILLNPLTGSALQSALDHVSPSRNAFWAYTNDQTAFSMSRIVRSRIENRMLTSQMFFDNEEIALIADASDQVCCVIPRACSGSVSGWLSGFGAISHQSAADQNPSFDFESEAILAGVDYRGPSRNLVGGSVGYFHSNLNEDGCMGHINGNTLFAALYGCGFITHSFYVSPAAWVFANKAESHRRIAFPGYSQTAEADISSWQLLPHLELGYDQEFSWGDLIPFSSLDWVVNFQDGYVEMGAIPFNTNQGSHTSSMLKSETGLKLAEKWCTNWGAFLLREKFSYIYLNPFRTGILTGSFAGTPGQFTVYASSHVQNLGAFSLDFLFQFGEDRSWIIDLNYEGEWGSRYWTNQLDLTFSKDF